MQNKIIYITQSGTLSRKDNTLFFKNEKVKKVIPVVGIEQIYCLGNVTINSQLLQFLTTNKVSVHFFNYHGYYSGSYTPRESYMSGSLLVNQVKYYDDIAKRCLISQNIVSGIAENMIAMLEHYQRHEKNVAKYIARIKKQVIGIKILQQVSQIMAVEGGIWQIFYSSFKEILPEEFVMNKRVKRPPNNPINALISFGNSVLYSYTLTKIYHTQLNPTISYLHEPFQRRFSLSLDICEVFKIPLVFGNIFNLVNRGALKVEKHFLKEVNYSVLNDEGRKIFLQYRDKRISESNKHPTLKRNVSAGSLIKYDCYKLIKHLMGDGDFIPYSMKEKK